MILSRLFNSIFLVVGVILLGVALFLYSNTSRFVGAAAKAEGKVVAMEAHRHRGKRGMTTSYYPSVVFQAATNEKIRFTSDFSTSPPTYHVGEKVTVLYRKDTPHDAQISDFWSLWFAPVLLTAMGTIFTCVGGALMFTKPFSDLPPGIDDKLRARMESRLRTPPYTRI